MNRSLHLRGEAPQLVVFIGPLYFVLRSFVPFLLRLEPGIQ